MSGTPHIARGEQMGLAFNRGLPVAINRRAVRRFVSRALRTLPSDAAKMGFGLREHLEDVAVLDQARRGLREQARELKREAHQAGTRLRGRALITCVCKPEGRRAQRFIDRLSERIAEREPRRCA